METDIAGLEVFFLYSSFPRTGHVFCGAQEGEVDDDSSLEAGIPNINQTGGWDVNAKIRVALLGLGQVGQGFAEHFLEIIQEEKKPVEIVAVADRNPDSPVALGFSQSGVKVFADALDVVRLGEQVDIIFDLTGSTETRAALRKALMDSNNRHTVIAPEVVAHLMWMFFGEPGELGGGKPGGY